MMHFMRSLAALGLAAVLVASIHALSISPSHQVSRQVLRAAAKSAVDSDAAGQIWLVGWDGCIADTFEWRMRMGMEAAAKVWPIAVYYDRDSGDSEWLVNKLRALSHVLSSTSVDNEGYSITCNYAYMVRLLLEEQELDHGRSVNASGKYAKRFHPQKDGSGSGAQSIITTNNSPSEITGTRPLTVGEIAANWNQGGMLCDTVRVKFRCPKENRKSGVDAMPILQSFLDEAELHPLPSISRSIASTLAPSTSEKHPTILYVNHESDLPMAMASLDQVGIQYHIANGALEAVDFVLDSKKTEKLVVLMVITNKSKGSTTWGDILDACPEAWTLHVVEFPYLPLERYGVPLFGDSIPRSNNVGSCRVPGRTLSLHLVSSNNHPTETSKAVMNAWMDTLSQEEFIERVRQATSQWG